MNGRDGRFIIRKMKENPSESITEIAGKKWQQSLFKNNI